MSQVKIRVATSFQIKAARALIGWTADDLSRRSAVSLRTIRRAELAERDTSITSANDLAVRHALEDAGVEFIDENGGGSGAACGKRINTKIANKIVSERATNGLAGEYVLGESTIMSNGLGITAVTATMLIAAATGSVHGAIIPLSPKRTSRRDRSEGGLKRASSSQRQSRRCLPTLGGEPAVGSSDIRRLSLNLARSSHDWSLPKRKQPEYAGNYEEMDRDRRFFA